MKINVTLDYYDGRLSKTKTMYAEDLPTGGALALMLHKQGVAGITITAAESIQAMLKHINQADEIETESQQ